MTFKTTVQSVVSRFEKMVAELDDVANLRWAKALAAKAKAEEALAAQAIHEAEVKLATKVREQIKALIG